MALPWIEARSPADERQRLGVVGRLVVSPLAVASWGYALGARLHRRAASGGWLLPSRLPCRVVSVGSPMVGGTGKTPVAAWMAARLRERGHRVVLATRGYGRLARDRVHVLTDGRHVHGDVSGVSDEPLVLAAHAAGVPILVGRDRSLLGLRAVSAFGADVLVLDDGFQHHRLQRDVDVVTLDGGHGFGNERVLPRGPLREPLSALAHAHAVGVVDGPLSPRAEELLARHAVRPFRFRARRVPATLRSIRGGDAEPATALAGLRIGVLAGIAQPESFERTLSEYGATLVGRRFFRDHHRYRRRDLRGLEDEAALWVTTEKDAVKILPGWVRADLRVLRIDLVVEEAESVVDWLDAQLGPQPFASSGPEARGVSSVARSR